MQRCSLSAVGADRPGIVAAVTGVLVDAGCNLEDSTMTILQGQFAILLVVALPDDLPPSALEAALAPVAERFDLVIAVRPLAGSVGVPAAQTAAGRTPPGTEGAPVPDEPWTVSVHGADRPGIVHAVTQALADGGGNVVDLATHLVGEPGAPVYVMVLRATLPPGEAGEAVARQVRAAASAMGVHCAVHRDDADVL